MKKKTFIILILPVLALVGGYFLREVWASSNPHNWTNGLVGYWSFDGQYATSTAGTRDVSNNGNWATFYNGVKPVAGAVGQALNFDGTNDYAQVASTAQVDYTGDFTIELWAYPRVFGNPNSNCLGDYRSYLTSQTYSDAFHTIKIITLNSNVFQFWVRDTTIKSVSTGALSTNQWYHLVGVRSGNSIIFYKDGVSVGTADITGLSFANISSNTFWMGAGDTFSCNNNNFNGTIDEVRIYGRALSAGEAKQHYDQTRRNFAVNQPSGTPPVGWWKMDEGTGTAVKDYSGNANNGTMKWMSTSTNGGWTDGKIGKALSFDGLDDYVLGSTLPFTTYPGMTIEAWVTRTGTGRRMIVSMGYAPWQFEVGLAGTDRLSIELNIDSVYYHLAAATPTPLITNDGKWHHVVFAHTLSTGTWTFYVDGVAYTTGTQAGAAYAGADVLRIGINNNLAGGYWQGLIDDVRIYSYARTADQIAADFRAGAYRTTVGASVPSSWWTNGLVGYWPFDGQYTTSTAGTRDTSGQNNWGTFNGGVKPVAGISGQALSFDGVDDYVEAPVLTPAYVTVEAWINMTSIITGYPRIISNLKNESGTWKGFEIYQGLDTREIRVQINVGGTWTGYSIGTPNLGEWAHVAFTSDGSNVRTYFNGVAAMPNAVVGTITYHSSPEKTYIGKNPNVGTDFNGLIDEVRIYNRALSADEILQHYQQTRRNLNL